MSLTTTSYHAGPPVGAERGGAAALRLLLFDPYPLVRAGLRVVLEGCPGVSLCGSVGHSEDLLQTTLEEAPDLAVVGLASSDACELDLVRRVTTVAPHLLVLVLAPTDTPALTKQALQAGARGLFPKHASLNELSEAVRTLASGNIAVTAHAADRLLVELTRSDRVTSVSPHALSPREAEVFEMMGRGLSRREMAQQLSLATKTVDAYRAQIKGKLDVATMPELMRRAVLWVSMQRGRGAAGSVEGLPPLQGAA